MGSKSSVGVAVFLAAFSAVSTARADNLAVTSLELGPWAGTVTALQHDVSSEGRVIHVQALDAHHHVARCGTYVLHLDEAGQRAFQVSECDPHTSLTEFRLSNRSALFDHDDVVPRPLAIALTATSVPTETVCRAEVRPSLEDMEHGTRVYLSAPRFSLRVLLAGIQATPAGDGWLLRGGAHPASVEYDVVDTTRNRIVLHEHAQIECVEQAVGTVPPTPVAASAGACGAVDLLPGTTVSGTTANRTDANHASCGGGAYSPDAVYRLVVPRRSTVRVELASRYDGVIYLRRDCAEQATELACNDDDPDGTHSRIETTLDPGTYYVFVDGYGSLNTQQPRAGDYIVRAIVAPLDGSGAGAVSADSTSQFAGDLVPGTPSHGTTAGGTNHFQGGCGAGASPDQTWRLVVRERSNVSVRLTSDFDGVLLIRRTLEGHEDDVHCNDDAGDARHSLVEETLAPGVYYVVVDGYSGDNSGAYELTATMHHP